jgi:hypothetical protein
MTLAQAAISVGSNVRYVMAAGTLLKAGDMQLINEVLSGSISIQNAAKLVEPQVAAIEAIKAASPANREAIFLATHFTNDLAKLLVDKSPTERAEAAAKLVVDVVWDTMVSPLVSAAAE